MKNDALESSTCTIKADQTILAVSLERFNFAHLGSPCAEEQRLPDTLNTDHTERHVEL